MKKFALILAILLAFSMVGCVAQTPTGPTEPSVTPTTAPATEATTEPPTEPTTEPTTAPTTEPTTEHTIEPTEEIDLRPGWLPDPVEYLSYEEFFAEERLLNQIGSRYWFYEEDDPAYYLEADEEGLYIFWNSPKTGERETVHRVPDSAWFRNSGSIDLYYYVSDGRYVYGVRDGNEIIRVELLTGAVESLYSGGEIMGYFTLYEEGVLYFAARGQEHVLLHRLYIPTGTLEILYDQIPLNVPNRPWFLLLAPETNLAPIGCKIMNPELYEHMDAVLADPNNKYVGESWWSEGLRDWDNHMLLDMETSLLQRVVYDIQEEYDIPYRLVCSYDYINDLYTEREEYTRDPMAAD